MKIWRLGQIHENSDWPIFVRENKLSFDWLDCRIDYSKDRNLKRHRGWTCIQPWVKELQKGDLIFIINKFHYAGVAIALDSYKYDRHDINLGTYSLPAIPIKFLHALKLPREHDIDIKARSPKVFYYINGIGFNMYKIMGYLKTNFEKAYNDVTEYLSKNKEAEANKISKVCWNEHDWKKPSGPEGKDKSSNTYEGENGFGHEEWIAEKFREIKGFHYGFLQTMNLKSDLHVDKIYNIDLITGDREGNFFHAGLIKNAICISKEEAEEVHKIYKKNNWIKEMLLEVKFVGGDADAFINDQVQNLFNIKYKNDDIHIFDDFKLRKISKHAISTYHYKLLDKTKQFKYENDKSDSFDDNKRKSEEDITRHINTTVTYDAAHSKMQNAIKDMLKKSGLYKIVRSEYNRIDIAAKLQNGNWHFYEIKTYGTAKRSIRHALGQILEYSYWPGRERAEKLIIVSDNPHNMEIINYMNLLREHLKIPIYYQSFNVPNILGELV